MHRIDLGRQDLEVLPPFFSLLIALAEYSSREAAAIPAACCLSGVRTQAYCWLAADSNCRNLNILTHLRGKVYVIDACVVLASLLYKYILYLTRLFGNSPQLSWGLVNTTIIRQRPSHSS